MIDISLEQIREEDSEDDESTIQRADPQSDPENGLSDDQDRAHRPTAKQGLAANDAEAYKNQGEYMDPVQVEDSVHLGTASMARVHPQHHEKELTPILSQQSRSQGSFAAVVEEESPDQSQSSLSCVQPTPSSRARAQVQGDFQRARPMGDSKDTVDPPSFKNKQSRSSWFGSPGHSRSAKSGRMSADIHGNPKESRRIGVSRYTLDPPSSENKPRKSSGDVSPGCSRSIESGMTSTRTRGDRKGAEIIGDSKFTLDLPPSRKKQRKSSTIDLSGPSTQDVAKLSLEDLDPDTYSAKEKSRIIDVGRLVKKLAKGERTDVASKRGDPTCTQNEVIETLSVQSSDKGYEATTTSNMASHDSVDNQTIPTSDMDAFIDRMDMSHQLPVRKLSGIMAQHALDHSLSPESKSTFRELEGGQRWLPKLGQVEEAEQVEQVEEESGEE